MDGLDFAGKLMVSLGVACAVYALTYAVLIWRGHFELDDVLEDLTEDDDREL